MASPLVATKLYPPKLRRSLVARPRLSGRLRRGAEARLTLVSAPAGFGKTTLLAEWLADIPGEGSVAWLSLEESDRQPGSFWTYVITALQTVVPSAGTSALPLLQSGQPPIETILTTVLNELSSVADDIHLVLDDYHLADGPGLQDGMTFLLEHLPPQVHLVVSTREDPDLPLARLRARGELVEVRAADLRFTLEEVAAYLNDVTGLDLAAGDIAALEARTEGWVAALQLAALSMQGRDDVAGFIATFAGDDRYIVDYLVDEVLGRQPDHVRSFLYQTSILDRLSGPLCDAVTGQPGGKAMLDSLDRANLFLVPLDDRRRWYRYHHLFADVLHTHLLDEHPDQVAALHRQASRWWDRNGEPSQAIRHALAAGDVERAASLVELAIPAQRRDRQEATIRSWLEALPEDVVQGRPVLAVGLIGALMAGGEFEGVEDRLREAERWLPPTSGGQTWTRPTGMMVVDEGEFQRLPAVVEMYRAALALVGGDAPATIGHAQRAMDRAAEADHLTRAGASALSGLARWAGGDLEAAHRAYSVAAEGLRRAGYIADVLGCSITLADIRITQGRLGEALATYERALRLAADQGGTVLRGTADMHVGISRIACERNDLAAATHHLRHAQELGEHTWLPQNPYRWGVAMAGVREAEGDLAGALGLLEEALGVYMGDFSPKRAADPGAAGTRAGGAGSRARGPGVGARAGPVGRRRPVLPARVRARHPGQGPSRPGQGPARRRPDARCGPAPGAPARGGRSRGADGNDHRDPGTAGAHQPRPRERPGCAGGAGARADPGRTGGVRPRVRRSGTSDGVAAASSRETGNRPEPCPSAPGGRQHAAGPARTAGAGRAVERTRAGRAPAALLRPRRARHRPGAHGLPEHPADPHQEHLRQARRQQPPGRGAASGRAQPAVAHPRPLTAATPPANHQATHHMW